MTGSGKAEFVVVANRLPVDLERSPTAGQLEAQPRRAGHRARADPARRGRAPGSAGRACADDDAGAVRGRRARSCTPSPLSAEDVEDYYEGFSNATLWPLYHDVVAPPAFHRHWWQAYVQGQRAVRRRRRRGRRRGRHGLGAGLPAPAGPGMLRELRPDLRIGFFLHIPFPPVELFMQLPWREQIVRGLLGADLVGFQHPGRRPQLPRGWPARLAGADRGRVTATIALPTAAPSGSAPSRSPSTPQALDDARRTPEVIDARRGDPRRAGRPAARCCSASTGSTTPRASTCGCAPSSELLGEERVSADDDACSVQIATPSRERVEHYQRLRAEIEQTGRARSTASTAGSAARPCTTCTSRCPATSWPRSTSPPTSCSSRRCATG